MTSPEPVPSRFLEPEMAERLVLLADSFHRLLGRELVHVDGGSPADLVSALWYDEAPIVAHGTQADPVFFFANLAALAAFESTLDQFTSMPSRYSAEAPEREERQTLLDRVSKHGYADDYRGVRITAKGRKFIITDGIVWNLIDPEGRLHGQAATFRPEELDD